MRRDPCLPGSAGRELASLGPALVRRFFCCVLSLLGLASSLTASEGDISLAKGLYYKRLQKISSQGRIELPKSAAVLDLRGTQIVDADALRSVAAWVDGSSHPPLRLVLIDSSTSSDVLQILESREQFLMTLGAASPAISPDVAVTVSLRSDQDARDALDAGKAPGDLLASKFEKPRYDEAAMVRDHASGLPLPNSPPDLSDLDPTEGDATTTPTTAPDADVATAAGSLPEAPLFDAVLQRAVHLYQSLVALKRITVE